MSEYYVRLELRNIEFNSINNEMACHQTYDGRPHRPNYTLNFIDLTKFGFLDY